jgi:hypothetical protein
VVDLSVTTLSLKLGKTQPANAPAEVLGSLRSIQVSHGTKAPSGFTLSFEADRYPPVQGTLSDYALLDSGLLAPFVRVQVVVQLGLNLPEVLIDGYITRQELSVDGNEKGTLTVTGEDMSVKMDLFERSVEYPNLKDSAIVQQILGKYSALGITASVTTPSDDSAPTTVPQQNTTDLKYLKMLAARHSYLFYLRPGPLGQTSAYWGPPVTTGTPQKTLTINMAWADTVKSLSFSYNALAPTLTYGQSLDLSNSTPATLAVAAGTAQSLGLSTTPAISSSFSSLAQTPENYYNQLSTLAVRGSLLLNDGLTPTDAQNIGTAKTNRSVQNVLEARGQLDTAKYGAILKAPGLVNVRGVGTQYDGTYTVNQVSHSLSLEQGEWGYTQSFALSRDGFGSTITSVTDF